MVVVNLNRAAGERFGVYLRRLIRCSGVHDARSALRTRLGLTEPRLTSVLEHHAPPQLEWVRGVCDVLKIGPAVAGQLFEAACEELRLGEFVTYTRAWNEARIRGKR